ncbi:hypothetical protein [Enterococcus sp. AZ109]
MKHIMLSSSLLATIFFFWLIRKEMHHELAICAIDQGKKNRYYPD